MDDGSSPYIRLAVFIIFIMINAIIYGFSAAIQNINESRLQKLADGDSVMANRVISIIDNPYKFVNTVQVISMLMSMFVGIYELELVVRIFGKYAGDLLETVPADVIYVAAYVPGALVIVLLMLSLGVLIPKKLGAKYSEKWAFSLVNIIYFLMIVFTPVTFLISAVTTGILKIFGDDPKDNNDNVTEEDIVSMVNEGHEQGVLLESEAAMINNIVEFGDKSAKDIMTHRKNLVAVNGEWSLNQTIRFILNENKSRFPVYIGDIDNVVGVLHLKDAVVAHEKPHLKTKKIKDIPNLFRETLYIPETKNINVLFKAMQSEKIHMVVVLDEYGQTSGIVAMEDILEEIVGNILDEYDEEDNNIIKQADGSYIVKGMTPIDELEDILGIDFHEEEYDTLNGFLISKLDHIPAEDERTEIREDYARFKILAVENKMISLVHVVLCDNTKSKESQDSAQDKEV